MKVLTEEGLSYVWQKTKSTFATLDGLTTVTNQVGKANGIASLDSNGYVPLSQLGNIDTTFAEVVTELPTSNIKKHLYLVKNDKEGNQNTYDEYIYTGDVDEKYDASKWEKLGDFVPDVDLDDYAKKSEAVTSITFNNIREAIGNKDGIVSGKDFLQLEWEYANGDVHAIEIPKAEPIGENQVDVGSDGLMSAEDKTKMDTYVGDELNLSKIAYINKDNANEWAYIGYDGIGYTNGDCTFDVTNNDINIKNDAITIDESEISFTSGADKAALSQGKISVNYDSSDSADTSYRHLTITPSAIKNDYFIDNSVNGGDDESGSYTYTLPKASGRFLVDSENEANVDFVNADKTKTLTVGYDGIAYDVNNDNVFSVKEEGTCSAKSFSSRYTYQKSTIGSTVSSSEISCFARNTHNSTSTTLSKQDLTISSSSSLGEEIGDGFVSNKTIYASNKIQKDSYTYTFPDKSGTIALVDATNDATRCSLALGHYSDRDDIVLTATETNKAISSDGVKVTKSGWAIAEFTAEKGNEYLFKPGTTDGSVCLFAEYIDKVEDRAIDYTYTYNADGTTATATATYGGKTYTYTYEWATDTGGNTVATIKDASGNVVTSLPLLYTTTVGTYSPLVRLNADAELPTDGYCRFMSHFQGNGALKVVVSYKVGSADLTMKVLRDGVFASISTQLGNLSQKQSQTESEIAAMRQSYVDIYSIADGTVQVDGKNVSIAAKTKTRLYPKVKFIAYALGKNLKAVNAKHLDTSGFTTFNNNWQGMFHNCSSLATLDVSGWDTSKVTSMQSTFASCSSLTTLDVSGWDTSKVTNMDSTFASCSSLTTLDVSGWDTSNVTSMPYTFNGCSKVTTLDVSGWDTSNVTSMQGTFWNCSSLTTLDVSGWDTSNVTNMLYTFNGCSKLTALDVSGWDTSKVTNMGSTFNGCSSLTTLIGSHTLEEVEAGEVVALRGAKVGLSLNNSTKLDRKSLLAVIKGLADLTGSTSQTLTLGNTLKAKLTSDDIAIATAKNWTIA